MVQNHFKLNIEVETAVRILVDLLLVALMSFIFESYKIEYIVRVVLIKRRSYQESIRNTSIFPPMLYPYFARLALLIHDICEVYIRHRQDLNLKESAAQLSAAFQ